MLVRQVEAFVAAMQPRDHASAGRAVSVLCLVGVGVTIIFAPLEPNSVDVNTVQLGLGIATLVAVGVISGAARRFDEANRVAWAVCPFLTIAAIIVIDYLTSDATISAEIFFLFPALYGASQLRRTGAVVVTAAAVAGEWIVVDGMLPLREAITNAGYVSAALATSAALLIRAGERQEELVGQLVRQAAIDPLTGLVTRRVLDEAAQSAMSGAASVAGTSLILLDVDKFKEINDGYGHPAGDRVLVQLAALLVESASPNEVVSRMGGDEIAILLPGSSMETLQRRAEQIVWEVRAHEFVVDQGGDAVPVSVSVSVGTAHAPTHAVDLHALYVAADAALYDAKHGGRDRVGTHAGESHVERLTRPPTVRTELRQRTAPERPSRQNFAELIGQASEATLERDATQ
jgi:diguanylate cyclase (GGDEF)-like protein